MDAPGRSTKHGTKKAQITIQPGARNIGGLVVIGASLAVAGLVGTFFFKKTKSRQFKKSESPLNGDEETKGVPSILQTSSEPICLQNRCCTSCEPAKMVSTQMDSSELASAKSLILEENFEPKTDVRLENSTCDHQNIRILDGTNSTTALGVLEDACEEQKLSTLPELDILSMAKTEMNHRTESSSGEQYAVKEDFEVKMGQKMASGSKEDFALTEGFEVVTDHKIESNSQENYAMMVVLENIHDGQKLSPLPELDTLSTAKTETNHKTESNYEEHSGMKEDFEEKMDRKMVRGSQEQSVLKEDFEVETDPKMESNSQGKSAMKSVLEEVCHDLKLSPLPELNTLSMAKTETNHKTESNSGEQSAVKEDFEAKMNQKMETGSQEHPELKEDFEIETDQKMESNSQENSTMKGLLEDARYRLKLSPLPELDTLSTAETKTNHKTESNYEEHSAFKEDFEVKMYRKMESGSQEQSVLKEDFEVETNHKMESNSQEKSAMTSVLEEVCHDLKLSPLPELVTLSKAETKTNHKTESNSGEQSTVKEDFEEKMDQKMETGSQEHPELKEDFEIETDQKMESNSQENSAMKGALEDFCGELRLSLLPELDTLTTYETKTNHKMESNSGEHSVVTEDFEVQMDQKMESGSQEDSALKNLEVETDHKTESNSQEISAMKGVLGDVCDRPKLSLLPELDTLSTAKTETNHKTERNPGEHFAVKEDFEVETEHKMESDSQKNFAIKEDIEVEIDYKMASDSQKHSALNEDFENRTNQEEEEHNDELVAVEKASLEKTALLHLQEGELEDEDRVVDSDKGQETKNKDYMIEKLEDGSEGTGSSSAESNPEAIWPAEFLAEGSLPREDTTENLQFLEDKIVQVDTTTKPDKTDHFNYNKSDILKNGGDDCEAIKGSEFSGKRRISKTIVVKDKVDNGVDNRNWIWSFLALMLCCYYYLPVTAICLTVLLVVCYFLVLRQGLTM